MREINENKIKKCITHWGERSICTIKATHYKDPPKILVDCEMEKEDEQDYSTGQFEKRQ